MHTQRAKSKPPATKKTKKTTRTHHKKSLLTSHSRKASSFSAPDSSMAPHRIARRSIQTTTATTPVEQPTISEIITTTVISPSPLPPSTRLSSTWNPDQSSTSPSFGAPAHYPEIADISQRLRTIWASEPTQTKSIQFPEWCLDKFLPTKPFTLLLDEIANSPANELPTTKKCVTEVFIPLWNAYHVKLKAGGPQFQRVVENRFSPSAVNFLEGQQKLDYPQLLHHNAPDILQITRRLFNLKTGEMNPVNLGLFETETVTETQFRELYDSTVLIRYLHHQENLLNYIKTKFVTLAEVALFDPSFSNQVAISKKEMAEDPELRATVAGYSTDADEFRAIPDLCDSHMDFTNPAIPIDLRYRYYVQRLPFTHDMLEVGEMKLPLNHLELLKRCSLPSDPILCSLHDIAKQLSKAELLVDGGLMTFPLRQMVVKYGKHVWDNLNLYINPTEENKALFYSERGFFDLDQFYAISLENRSTGGWKGRNDPMLPYPLTSVANPDKTLSEPLGIKKVMEYGLKYLGFSHLLNKLRTPSGSYGTTEMRDPSTQYLKVLYTAKTMNQDQFGTGIDLRQNRLPKASLLSSIPANQSFLDSFSLLVNPTTAKEGQMLGMKHFSEDFRYLYENSSEFRETLGNTHDDETRNVVVQLEAAFSSIQRQHERHQYHVELERAKTPAGVEFVPPPFHPDPTTLKRYNDQAYYLQEITHDLEVFAKAFYKLVGSPKTEYHQYVAASLEVERDHSDREAEERLAILKWAPRQSSIFLEKWLAEAEKPDNKAAADAMWADFVDANRMLHKYCSQRPDRRRVAGILFTDVIQALVKTQTPPEMSPDTRHLSFAPNHPGIVAQERANMQAALAEKTQILEVWEGPTELPAQFEVGDDEFPPPLDYISRPKGPKGERRVVSRFEFPTREDIYTLYTELKPIQERFEATSTLATEDRLRLNYLQDFYSLTEVQKPF